MNEQQPTTLISCLEEQNARIQRLNSQIMQLLQRSGFTIPTQIPEEFDQIHTNFNQLLRQLHQLAREKDNLRALVEVGQVINSSLQLNDVLRIVMDTIIRLLKAERGFLMLRNKHGQLVIHVARNWEKQSVNPSDFAISRTIVQRVIREGEAILTTNAQEDPRFGGQESVITHHLRSIICVPLKFKNRLTGVIYADNRIRTGLFSENERDLLVAFANQAAVAIENARLFESLRRTLGEVTELKNLMDHIFASIASGVITSDADNRITSCNQSAQSILGLDQEELIGCQLEKLLPFLSEALQYVKQYDQHLMGLEFTSHLPKRGPVILRFNLSPLKEAQQVSQGVAIVMEDLTERKRLEAHQRLFERMLHPAVIDQLDPDALQLGGRRVEITTLFVDIRDFTGFSEQLSPEVLVSILNRYLAVAAEAVLAYEGTIDKFLGDAVMAWFNAPIPQPDHTLRAVLTALKIREETRSLHKELPSAYNLSFGAGIHTGEAILGLVGTEKRLEYTAIGDCVNTAKRIQENAAAEQILISAEAYARVARQVNARPAGAIQAKGKRQPVLVYEVLGLK